MLTISFHHLLSVDKLEDGSIKREKITSVIYVPLTSADLQYGDKCEIETFNFNSIQKQKDSQIF